jgi:hypothetical protein
VWGLIYCFIDNVDVMRTYIAESQIDDMVTDLTFDAVNDAHADLITRKHGWKLLGELVFEVPSK